MKNRTISLLLGIVSLFYWLCAWNVPTFQLVDSRGRPLGGLGVLLSIFNEQYFIALTITVSLAFLVAFLLKKSFLAQLTAAISLGLWIMLATAYAIYSVYQHSISPNLVLIIGYCCVTWIELKRAWPL
ncbi:hypothetical protein JZO81_19455 [Enterococcus hulanensis]|uniref:hypothetical protein n=1 Tax=Enterococcus TaxID=1350 RepID=UPI000B5A7C49|nr:MULTISPECIES: hypothetical protein [Enterococcus]MBO0413238.1 hypothetical protein [Enterococcus hulanensis]OTO15093.1 hypothetical protein A5875_004250 [Enterococcus sp. 3H8_DIV0648]